ncbi:MAG: fumarate hydratase [Candidatus Izemoplasmatales bacterium]|nr:fumarate hydratase [Candidatus Izemoplasmatales bacterium]MDD4595374.1 fumarate hydratase [Candidatus Izemoplasmatales bacterium]
MRTISKEYLISELERIIIEAATVLDDEVVTCLQVGKAQETSKLPIHIIDEIIDNQLIARNERIPICQDTGVAVFFVEIGNDLHFDYNLTDAINQAVRNGYINGYLRKSIVNHPLDRKNTLDNTPAIIHYSLISGDRLRIRFAPKGGGSENMSKMTMLTPADGRQGIIDFVVNTVKNAGGKACPPIILGIGIGGNFEKSALLAKEALFRKLSDEALNPLDKKLEEDILKAINETNVGPMGLKGKTTCLAVKVNSFSCHIASLPVAVNIQCHAARHKEVIL